MLLALVVAFGNGVLSFAAPCTVPLLPAFLGVLSRATAGVPEAQWPRRLVVGSLLYVAGFTAVFVLLGVLAGSLGSRVGTAGSPVQRAAGGIVLLVAALLLAEARLGWLTRLAGGDGSRSQPAWSRSLGAPVLLGVVFGTAFAPFVGPFLATALALAATSTSTTRGGVLIAAYAIGIGVPFVLAALGVAGSPRLARTLARVSGPLALGGAMLLALLGLVLVAGRYGVLAGWLARMLPFASG